MKPTPRWAYWTVIVMLLVLVIGLWLELEKSRNNERVQSRRLYEYIRWGQTTNTTPHAK